jgi:hypothetical protein
MEEVFTVYPIKRDVFQRLRKREKYSKSPAKEGLTYERLRRERKERVY